MAAVNVDRKSFDFSIGRVRVVTAQVDIPANGDTLTLPELKKVVAAFATPSTAAACGVTIATNVVTFVTGGALANVQVLVIGY